MQHSIRASTEQVTLGTKLAANAGYDMSGGRLRILHILAPGCVGGLQVVVRQLASGHRRRGHEVAALLVLDRSTRGHPLMQFLQERDVTVRLLSIPARAYWKEWRATRALCRRWKPDVVHTHGYRSDVIDAPAARRAGIPVVSTVHGFTSATWRVRIYEWLQRHVWSDFDAVVAVSQEQYDRALGSGVPASRVHLIPNAWCPTGELLPRTAARRALSLPSDQPWIGWVGRLSPEKGADVFLGALRRLRASEAGASVIGDGSERQALEALARRLGLRQRIRWHGVVPDAGRLLRAFDVFVLSSRSEGIPIVLFEAIAAGVPIVATRVGGVPDVLVDNVAVMVPPEDPGALADAIRSTLADMNAAEKRARGASALLSERFGSDSWLDAYEQLYYRVVRPVASSSSRASIR